VKQVTPKIVRSDPRTPEIIAKAPLRMTTALRRPSPSDDRPDAVPPTMKATLTAKVELVEKWAREGVPEGRWWPLGVTELRQWHEPDLGLFAWSNPNAMTYLGPYLDLRQRFDAAIDRIVATHHQDAMLSASGIDGRGPARNDSDLVRRIEDVVAENQILKARLEDMVVDREALREARIRLRQLEEERDELKGQIQPLKELVEKIRPIVEGIHGIDRMIAQIQPLASSLAAAIPQQVATAVRTPRVPRRGVKPTAKPDAQVEPDLPDPADDQEAPAVTAVQWKKSPMDW
jgi:hypothetical protein